MYVVIVRLRASVTEATIGEDEFWTKTGIFQVLG